MGKYPYFLDKNVGSNFYRSSDVNNRSVQRLYNELFKLYESFHISKRLLIWREQHKDYDYNINFEVNYPNIKEVSIYKDDKLIYWEEFPILIRNDDNIDESTDHFHYTYTCEHKKEYIQKATIYRCNHCGEIYYTTDNTLPPCKTCNNNTYTRLEAYKCTECGEIYYTTENTIITDCTKNNHTETLQKQETYKCLSCNTIHHTTEPLTTCNNCNITEYTNKKPYKIQTTHTELLTDNTVIKVTITNNTNTETITLNHENNWNITTPPLPYNNREYYITDTTVENNYEIPQETQITITELETIPTTNNLGLSPPEYYDDETIIITDNSNTTDRKTIEITNWFKYHITVQDPADEITLTIKNQYNQVVDTIVLNEANNYTADTKELDIVNELNGEEYEYHFIYDHSNNLEFTEIPIYHSNVDEDLDSEHAPLEIPIIPINQFRMEVLTYDEYYLVKGYPERDEPLRNEKNRIVYDIYDHDASLDEIGALNNIPRKKYNIVEDYVDYPLTEPPYNNNGSEDDYHYMNRMLEYVTRLWWMNPVSLELWKIYGLESELVNREKYILKVFDEQKHPFDDDTGLVKCWTPLAWEHKDRFCNMVSDEYYFFVSASNVRPLLYESVDFEFKLLDNHGESVKGHDFYVDIYKIHEDTSWLSEEYVSFREQNNIIGATLNNPNDYYELVNKFHDVEQESLDGNVHYKLKHIDADRIRVPSQIFDNHSNDSDGVTSLLFVAYELNTGEEIGRCDVSIRVRDSNNADFYVDQDFLIKHPNISSDEYVATGSRDAPFLDLQSALDNVNVNNDLICLSSMYVDIPSTLTVSETTNIIGENLNVNSEKWIPRIRVAYHDKYTDSVTGETVNTGKVSRRFFNLIGGKNINLNLANLRLKSGEINNYVKLQSWVNSNRDVSRNETVIVRGGVVKLNLEILDEYTDYYPYDFIPFKLTVTGNNDSTRLSGMDVNLYYKGEFVKSYVTDSNGVVSDVFNLNEEKSGEYSFTLGNQSNAFFESQYTYNFSVIDCTYEDYYDGESFTWDLTDYTAGEEIKIFIDGEYVDDVIVGNDGTCSYDYEDVPFGNHVLYTTLDNVNNRKVKDECILEVRVAISNLAETVLVKDLTVNPLTYEVEYDTVTVEDDFQLSDLNGVVTDIIIDNNGVLHIDSFECSEVDEENDYVTINDYNELKKSLTDFSFDNSTGVLSFNRVGDFK